MFRIFLMIVLGPASILLALPPVPTQYQYPSLVCGTPLPQPSTTAQASLKTLYTECLSQNCNQAGNYSGDFANKLAQAVFAKPQALIAGNQSTIFCAFFGKLALDYVNCAYKLSARINYQGDTCTMSFQQTSPTPVLGPNKAAFTLEQRTVQKVKELIFNGPGRFAGIIEGFAKNKLVQSLNCNSLTRSHSITRAPLLTQTEEQTPSESESRSEGSSQSQLESRSRSLAASFSYPSSTTLTKTRTKVPTSSKTHSEGITFTAALPTPAPPTPVPPTRSCTAASCTQTCSPNCYSASQCAPACTSGTCTDCYNSCSKWCTSSCKQSCMDECSCSPGCAPSCSSPCTCKRG